jgi:hypothetical protein
VLKCSGVLQCSDGLSTKVSNIISSLMDNMKLLLVCILRVLFDNVIYAFLLLLLYIVLVFLYMTILTEVLPCFFLSCKVNAKDKTSKDVARPALFLIFVFFYVFFVLFYVLFVCVVLCIVCVYMCNVLLPPGGYPVAVKYILYQMYEQQTCFGQNAYIRYCSSRPDGL